MERGARKSSRPGRGADAKFGLAQAGVAWRSRARQRRCLRIPDPPPRLDERVLAHAADEDFRRSLASWANHALRAEQYDTFIARIADRAKLDATLNVGARAAAKAKELGVLDATPKELKGLGDLAQTEARERAAVVQLIADVLAAVGRDPKREIEFKAEAMVAGYLHHVAALPRERYRWRSSHSIKTDASKR